MNGSNIVSIPYRAMLLDFTTATNRMLCREEQSAGVMFPRE